VNQPPLFFVRFVVAAAEIKQFPLLTVPDDLLLALCQTLSAFLIEQSRFFSGAPLAINGGNRDVPLVIVFADG
jgi:hypothetical protein